MDSKNKLKNLEKPIDQNYCLYQQKYPTRLPKLFDNKETSSRRVTRSVIAATSCKNIIYYIFLYFHDFNFALSLKFHIKSMYLYYIYHYG